MTQLATLAALGQNRRGLGMLPPVHAVFQPVVHLGGPLDGALDGPGGRDVVGYEALARGPHGTEWEYPAALFADARRYGVEAALDWECRGVAMSAALRRRLPASVPLFVNADPAGLDSACPAHLGTVLEQAARRLQLVVEFPERALLETPDVVRRAVEIARDRGWGVAVDDVGGDSSSLPLLAGVEPDVIKLDLGLLERQPEALRFAEAVGAHAQATGAVVVAERIETLADLDRARMLGATLGQGYLLGRPGPLPAEPAPPRHEISFTR
ncbi:EAL domain-containing protein [Spongisporangium articulatum]|uniref:EAL domain-containing protein n=1 Tax=Spongisporangium articulatum TaxID=3362603 RepID=A0ABW8AL57_9ACTN